MTQQFKVARFINNGNIIVAHEVSKLQLGPEAILNELMMFMFVAIVAVTVLAFLVEYGYVKPPMYGRNKFTKTMMLVAIFVFYTAMIIGVFYALSSGLMTIPDLDPFTMRSAFDTISLMLIMALFGPILLMLLLRVVVKHP